jgi:RIO-like serine/threonine protein kinase
VEDYLKAIYRLSLKTSPVATSDIAQALELSAPSVSGMVKRLSEQGLLEHVPYKGVELTDLGRQAALGMLRRHRILETYLVEKLGFTWESGIRSPRRPDSPAGRIDGRGRIDSFDRCSPGLDRRSVARRDQ